MSSQLKQLPKLIKEREILTQQLEFYDQIIKNLIQIISLSKEGVFGVGFIHIIEMHGMFSTQ